MALESRVGLMQALESVLELMSQLDPEETEDLGEVFEVLELRRQQQEARAAALADKRKAGQVLQECLERAAKRRAGREAPTWSPGR